MVAGRTGGGAMIALPGREKRNAAAEPPDSAVVGEAVAEMLRVCRLGAAGDFETRVRHVPGSEEHPELVELRHELNRMIDRMDAFVREAAASLQAASEGRFHRQFLLEGMPGSFRTSAEAINRARVTMAESAARAAAAGQTRLRLADEFESTVMSVAEQVAAASTELSTSAASLAASASASVREAESAKEAVGLMEDSSKEIQQVVTLISQVAGQTRLLSLNATIEAARAGEAGRGFAVVASEVKQLATQTADATGQIAHQVASAQSAAREGIDVIETIGRTVRDMDTLAHAIAAAVDGGSGGTGQGDGVRRRRGAGEDHAAGEGLGADARGLARTAELLRSEVSHFLAVMREG
ncbi:methyl-accepting chemotaxis protein [Planomonospora parontospora]|nr:methyl-accepting chemotaxis protein [Planomonospora parontospora]